MELHPAEPLTGRFVSVELLAEAHREGLRDAAEANPEIFRFMAWPGDFDRYFDEALASPDVPFAVCVGGTPVGSTRYMNYAPEHRRVEIGWTWLRRSAWGTGANVETKYLLLRHAFEELGMYRVEFKTDAKNDRARAALAALPAEFEGIHRKHMVVRGGERRDSAWYAVIDDAWPEVKAALEQRIEAKA